MISKATGAALYATQIVTHKGTMTFYSASDRPLYFHALDACTHATSKPQGADGLKPDPRILAIYDERS